MTCEKTEMTHMYTVDNYVDLVDFCEISSKRGEIYSQMHVKKSCKLTCMVLSWSI